MKEHQKKYLVITPKRSECVSGTEKDVSDFLLSMAFSDRENPDFMSGSNSVTKREDRLFITNLFCNGPAHQFLAVEIPPAERKL